MQMVATCRNTQVTCIWKSVLNYGQEQMKTVKDQQTINLLIEQIFNGDGTRCWAQSLKLKTDSIYRNGETMIHTTP
jgi:hypothetical protein